MTEEVRTVEPQARIVHGPGSVSKLGEAIAELGMSRPMVLVGKNMGKSPILDEAAGYLGDHFIFDGVRPNPDISLVDGAAEVYRSEGCDGLIAVGGGSSMDTAKAVGVVVANGGQGASIADYEYGKEEMKSPIPPLVTIPTTAGTGSEVTLWSVLTDHDRGIKFNVGGTALISPRIAIVDPQLMLGLSRELTAATGMDALSHGIECYTCDYHQPFNDAMSLAAIEFAAKWLRRAVADGSDIEARTGMAHAATFGGLAYGTESAGAAHAMSQSAGGMRDCSHGALTARVLGPVCEFNVPASPERYARIAQALGLDTSGLSDEEAAYAGVEEIHALTEEVGIPSLEQLGFSEEEIPELAKIAFEDSQTPGNPGDITTGDYADIYRRTFARSK